MTQLKEIVGYAKNIEETSKKLEDSLSEVVGLQENPHFIEQTKNYLDSVLCVCGHHKSDHFPKTNECVLCDCKQLRLRSNLSR